MLLRSISKNVKDQNWFAVVLDFFIVAAGILIAFQITNWNEERALDAREEQMLLELRTEIENSIGVRKDLIDALTQVGEAGVRSLDFLESGKDCADKCWQVVVDFLHASQWQSLKIDPSIFQEMRRESLPQSRTVINAVQMYYKQNNIILDTVPEYRTLIRQLIPVAVQDVYWAQCYLYKGGIEYYSQDCSSSLPAALSRRTIIKIKSDPKIELTRTEWTGHVRVWPIALTVAASAGERAIVEINLELERRK